MSSPPRWLKRGLHRDVELRPGADGAWVVVKHYRSRGALRRLGDRRRAAREEALLAGLHAAGVRVPRPLALERGDRGWRLAMERVEGARTLAELLGAGGVLPADLARTLGGTLGRAHALGMRHGDLHAGNLLVDSRGEGWIVDLASARHLDPHEEPRLREDLVALLADSIERAPQAALARFVAAWLAEQPASRRRRWREPAERRALVAEARRHRRRSLRRHADRWRRESGLCAAYELDRARLLVARDAPPHLADAPVLAALFASGQPASALRERGLVLDAEEGAALRWTRVGIARQHALPALAPLALRGGPDAEAALYHGPPGLRPAVRDGSDAARALDRALGLRGYAPEERGLWRTPDGALRLGPGCALEETHLG